MGQYGASQAWEALSSIRLSVYSKIVSDPKVIRENRWPHTVALLGFIRRAGCRIGLATMSPRLTAERILRILRVYSVFWVLVTAEDVKKGKPDPEVYLVAAAKLDVAPPECLVLEDSVNGVEAAIAAGAHVIAIATPFTECALRSDEELKRKGDVPVVRSSGDVAGTVRRRIEELNAGGGRLAGACPL